MATDVEIANQALLRVGAESITSGEWNTPSNERSRAVKNSWPFVRREVLRAHPWNSVTARSKVRASYNRSSQLVPVWDYERAYPLPSNCLRVLECDVTEQWRVELGPLSATVVGGLLDGGRPSLLNSQIFVQTTGTHGLSSGDIVYMTQANEDSLNGQFSEFELLSTTQGSLIDLPTADFATTGSTSGALNKVTLGPCIVTEDTAETVSIRWVKDVTDPSEFDSMLTEALVLRLAVEIVERVTDSTRKREALMVEYQEFLREVKHIEGQEQSPSDFEEDLWISSRY